MTKFSPIKLFICCRLLPVAVFLFSAFACYGQFPNPVLLNTASNAAGTGTVPTGSNDLNWTVALTNSVGPYVPAVSCANQAPGNWANSPFPNANWITYPHTCLANVAEHSCLGNVDEFYKLTINLPATSCGQPVSAPGAYCLSLDFFADNWVHEIFVNNVSSFFNPTGNPYNSWGFSQGNAVSVSLCNNWQPGVNTVIVHIKSGAPTFPGFAGFLAQANQTLNPAYNNPVSSTVTATSPQCNNGTGSATVSASGGNGNYTYTWMPSGGNSSVANSLSSGNYTVSVAAGNTCVSTQTFSITQPQTFSLSVSPSTVVCNGSAVTLTAGGANTYLWSNGVASGSVSVTTSGIYTVTGTANGCSQQATVSVSISNAPSLTVSATNTVCAGGSVILNASGATNYLWSNGTTSSSVSVSPLTSTVYSVTGHNGNPSCSSTTTLSVLVYENPQIAISGAGVICGTGTVNLTASGADSYSWSNGSSGASINVSPTSSSVYSVTGISSLSGCTGTASSQVTVSTLPQVSVNNVTVCAGKTVTLSATGATSYLWSNGSQGSIISFSVISSEAYTVTGYGSSSACTDTKTVSVTVLPAPLLTVTSPSAICRNQWAILSASGSDNYQWSTGDSEAEIIVNPQHTSIYTVSASNITSGCVSTATAQVNVNPLPEVIIHCDENACEGEYRVISATGADIYEWPSGLITNSLTIYVKENLFIHVTGTDLETGCKNTDTIRLGNSPKCCEIFIPNTFTPDGDRLNDEFGAKTECKFREFHFYVFDKWGEKIFESDDIQKYWNGYYKGKLCEQDVYVYLIRALRAEPGIKPLLEKNGHVLLLTK